MGDDKNSALKYFIGKGELMFRLALVYSLGFDNDVLDIYEENGEHYGYMKRAKILTKFKITETTYSDKAFRWSVNDFNVDGGELVINLSKDRILGFNAIKVRERLAANKPRLKHSKDKKQWGCNYEIVKDLVKSIPISRIEGDLDEYYKKNNYVATGKGKEDDNCIDNSCKVNIN